MAKTWYADSYISPFDDGLKKHQPFSVTSNMEVKVIRTRIICYNDPVFTSIGMRIQINEMTYDGLYLELFGVPAVTVVDSTNNVLKSEITTLDNAVKDIYFEFDHLVLKTQEKYRIELILNGYTGTADSHLAWVKGVANPYDTQTYDKVEIALMPYYLGFIGADL